MLINGITNHQILPATKCLEIMSRAIFLAIFLITGCQCTGIDFKVYRMSQYDVNGGSHGLSMEAKTAHTWRTNRHCIIARFEDFSIDEFRLARLKAGGLVLLLPENIATMTREQKEEINLLENAMMMESISIPVYFAYYNTYLESIIWEIKDHSIAAASASSSSSSSNPKGQQQQMVSANNENKTTSSLKPPPSASSSSSSSSSWNELISLISANGYQVSVTGTVHAPTRNCKMPIIHGELLPPIMSFDENLNSDGEQQYHPNQIEPLSSKQQQQLPTIVIAANLKTFGLFDVYPLNADSAILLTLADVFSKLYNNRYSTPKYRLVFLLTESEHMLNYQSTKKWLEENGRLMQNIEFVICLDTTVDGLNGDMKNLYMHVSKPPKQDTPLGKFFEIMRNVAKTFSNDSLTMHEIHKKINLADYHLAWKHERFSMKRNTAFTLSALNSAKHAGRKTIFRQSDEINLKQMLITSKILAESMIRYILNLDKMPYVKDTQLFNGTMAIKDTHLKAYMNIKSATVNNDLQRIFEKYLQNVHLTYNKPTSRDPEFMMYTSLRSKLNIYNVKPAVFDLFVTMGIGIYLTVAYYVITNFALFYTFLANLFKPPPTPTYSRRKHKHN